MERVLTIRRPDDFHLHLRDGDMLASILSFSVQQFARALVMPNLKPPITTVTQAKDYRSKIEGLLKGADFAPLMSCYLCDSTPPAEIETGFKEGVFAAVKYYPAGATTHSDYGVTAVHKVAKVLEVMQKIGLPLLIHGESTDPAVDIFDREAVFIDKILIPMLKDFPALKVVLEHITTAQAAEFVAEDASGRLAATMTPQHLMFNRNALFAGGIRPHYYCLPVLKREKHRLALRKAATSGASCFFLGTDSAPHARHTKECDCGCAGIFNSPVAMQAYAQVFEEEGALDKLEKFSSENGARFYGLPLNQGTLTLCKKPSVVPTHLDLQGGGDIHPFLGGQEMPWTVAP